MQRSSIGAVFLGALVLLSAAWIVQKPLLQVYWALNSRIPDYTHLAKNNPLLRIDTGNSYPRAIWADQAFQRSSNILHFNLDTCSFLGTTANVDGTISSSGLFLQAMTHMTCYKDKHRSQSARYVFLLRLWDALRYPHYSACPPTDITATLRHSETWRQQLAWRDTELQVQVCLYGAESHTQATPLSSTEPCASMQGMYLPQHPHQSRPMTTDCQGALQQSPAMTATYMPHC